MKRNFFYDKKIDCCGCGACANICPKNIVEMISDEEGFLYPQMTAPEACIGCCQCETVCPVRHVDEIHSHFEEAFAGWCSDGSGVTSASGGAAYMIALNNLTAKSGVVYGVQYTDDCKAAVYCRGESCDDIQKMKSSKYIQSRKNDVYKQIMADLNNGRQVLFIGLPCDTFAVKKYTEGCCGKLVTVSLICHGPTSESVHKSFCEEIEKKYRSEIQDINVRYKKNGHWKPYYIRARLENGKEYIKKFQTTNYDVAFQNFKRPSCTDCRFKNDHFCADILIGDFHCAQKGTESYNKTGVSSILPLSDTGREIVRQIRDDFKLCEVGLKQSISQRAIHSSTKSDIDRTAFAEALNKKGLRAACKSSDVLRKKRKIAKKRAVVFVKSIIYNLLRKIKLV